MGFDLPRPKRSTYTRRHQKLVGRGTFTFFDERAYNAAVTAWEEERQKYNQDRRDERNRGGAGRVAKGIVSGAITMAGAYGDVTVVPQSGDSPLRDEAKSITESERTNRARTQRGATRDKGNRTGGSGQQ